MIVQEKIPGSTVYGVAQACYNVDGESGLDYTAALTGAAFKQSTAIEASASGYMAVVKARQKKVDDLGKMLAYLSKAVGALKSKAKSTDKVTVDNSAWVKSTASSYGISLPFESNGSSMTRGNIQKAQTTVEYELDKEDNNLQQDIVALQSFISKRDNAYSTAAKLVKKANNAASSTIRNIE